MSAYYNDNDPFVAAWLRELIKRNLIAQGEVDERSIADVKPSDLNGFTQCHFFAGIGGWSYALRLAGWPDDRPVWTGSCPCQPFSAAGQRKGVADERHLWPAFFHLISQSTPRTLFGEQVASKDGLGWFDTVQADLESASYACWAWDLCAAGVGAPHIRQRLYFVADANNAGSQGRLISRNSSNQRAVRSSSLVGELDNSASKGLEVGTSREVLGRQTFCEPERSGYVSPWSKTDQIWCVDGRTRPVEPGTFPLAHGVPNRVGRLRGYGNAIVPQVAEAFIESYMEATDRAE